MLRKCELRFKQLPGLATVAKCCLGLTLFATATTLLAEPYDACGSLKNPFGPFDYRTAPPDAKLNVESHHFTAVVETLQGGATAVYPGPDIDYTLRTMPNHPRALMAMMNLSFKDKRDPPRGSRYSVACWFERAIRFQPEDGMVRMLHGFYLLKRGEAAEAVKELEEASKNIQENANLQYNLGLAYFEVKDYERALANAQEAYRLGFQLEGLRRKLVAVGKWRDPVAATSPGTVPNGISTDATPAAPARPASPDTKAP
jgi:tetratricopeptide (TPR) repeat protein